MPVAAQLHGAAADAVAGAGRAAVADDGRAGDDVCARFGARLPEDQAGADGREQDAAAGAQGRHTDVRSRAGTTYINVCLIGNIGMFFFALSCVIQHIVVETSGNLPEDCFACLGHSKQGSGRMGGRVVVERKRPTEFQRRRHPPPGGRHRNGQRPQGTQNLPNISRFLKCCSFGRW